jgi:hypothetical protein
MFVKVSNENNIPEIFQNQPEQYYKIISSGVDGINLLPQNPLDNIQYISLQDFKFSFKLYIPPSAGGRRRRTNRRRRTTRRRRTSRRRRTIRRRR